MQLHLHRLLGDSQATLGELYIDNVMECVTLEDPVRRPGVKIYGDTAIPAGTYKVIINYSPKFKRLMPRLLNVPMFDGILIHSGATPKNTLGCVLVGTSIVGKHQIAGGHEAFDKLFDKLSKAKDDITLTITNDFET